MSKILSDADLEVKVVALADAKSKRAAVQAKFGDEAIKDASDAEIAGMYRVIGDAKDDTVRKAIADMKPGETDASDPWAKFIKPKKEGK
jgi:hypothetical protein